MKVRHYQHDNLGSKFVKRGFCWSAFFFTFIWAFIFKLWTLGFKFVNFLLLLLVFEIYSDIEVDPAAYNFVGLLSSIFFGTAGNSFRAIDLEKRGYKLLQEFKAPFFVSTNELEKLASENYQKN